MMPLAKPTVFGILSVMSYRKSTSDGPPPTLKAWRQGRGFTLQKAADVIGVPLTTYYWIERGGVPRPALLRRILDITGMRADDLAARVA